MKNLQSSYNEDAKKILEKAEYKINFLIDLATIAIVAKDKVAIEEEPQNFK